MHYFSGKGCSESLESMHYCIGILNILSVLLFAMVYGVLLGVALSPAQNIINDITSGIGMGMATVVVAFVGLVEVKNRLTKRRNKREDADQEKSDTE